MASNLVGRDFQGAAPNRVWVGDVKAVHTARGGHHLAVLMARPSRKILDISVANDTNLALAVLCNSVSKRETPPGVVHHTDQGSLYASAEYLDVLEEQGALPSMSRARDYWDHAVAESGSSTFTTELLDGRRPPSPEWAAAEIADYIDGFYNLAKRHSTIGYVSLIEYEARHLAAASTAQATCLRNRVKARKSPNPTLREGLIDCRSAASGVLTRGTPVCSLAS